MSARFCKEELNLIMRWFDVAINNTALPAADYILSEKITKMIRENHEKKQSCTDCPHSDGTSYMRDCDYPYCVGGWQAAYADLQKSINAQIDEAFNLGKLSNCEQK